VVTSYSRVVAALALAWSPSLHSTRAATMATRSSTQQWSTGGSGALLAFCEARKGNGGDGAQIDVGFLRSTDSGRSWSALQSIVPNDQSPSTLGNNVLVFCVDQQHSCPLV
jgi:hypothetical protein